MNEDVSVRDRDKLSQRDRHTQTENVRENVSVRDRDILSRETDIHRQAA